jgi:phage baseplate assembly protein gpV
MSEGFKSTWDDEEGEEKLEPFFYWAIVTNNQDTSNRGRVRGNIIGLTSGESTWMEPVAMPGSGGSKHGGWLVPAVGATVLVGFVQGDLDSPFYFSGPYPSNQAPDNNNPDNVVFQTEDFRISFIEQTGNKRLRLETVLPGIDPSAADSVRSVIELTVNSGASGKSHVINITAPGGLNLTSQGTINIDAPVVTIKGRSVGPTDEVI